MSVLKVVLEEEIERLEFSLNSYQKLLETLPRGTIFVRKIHNASFAYRKRKEEGKVVSEYLGPINSAKTIEEVEKSKEFKRIKKNISILKADLTKLRKAMKVYE